MGKLTRRDFLKTSAGSASAMAAVPALLAAREASAAAKSFAGNDVVALGKTGIRVSRLAQGTGMNGVARSSDHTRMGKPAFERLVHHSLDEGINFLDMADLYGTHPYVKDALRGMNRKNFVYLSKIWARQDYWVSPSGGAVQEVDRFRKELNIDRLDICLIHCMLNDKWPTTYERVRDELSSLKDKGVVRAVGVSCHDFGALEVAAKHPWVDVIFARINNKGGSEYYCDGTPEAVGAVLKTARRNGKAVVGMKIFGAGKLVKPEEKDASLKYVFENDLVDAITVGMTSPEQVDDTLKRMSQVPVA